MNYLKYEEARGAYLELMKICEETENKLNKAECEIVTIFYDYYLSEQDYSLDFDEKIASRAFTALKKIEKVDVILQGTIEILGLLNYELFWVLNENERLELFNAIQRQLSLAKNSNLDRSRKIEIQVYLNDLLAEYLASEYERDFEGSLKYFDENLYLINISEDNLDWENWKTDILQRKIQIYDRIGDIDQALESSLLLFLDTIQTYEKNNEVEPIISKLIYLGERELGLGNDNRSELYFSIAFTLISEISIEKISQDVHWQLDQLMYQLLPSLNCDDSNQIIEFHRKRINYLNENSNKFIEYASEPALNSLILNQIFCEDDFDKQKKSADLLYKNINRQIDENINQNYSNFTNEIFINADYFESKFTPLNDISDFISKSDRLKTINKVQSLVIDHINSELFFDDPAVNYGYSLLLTEGICILPKSKAKRNLKVINGLVDKSDFFNYFSWSPSGLDDLYLHLVLIPSNCGLQKETKEIFNKLISINEDFDPFNILGSGSYGLNSNRLLASSIHNSEIVHKNSFSNIITGLRSFNREPSELNLYLENQKDINKEITEYLKYQSNLNALDNIFAKAIDSQLDLIKKDLTKVLESFKRVSPNFQETQNFIDINFYRKFDLNDIQEKLDEKEALIIYSYNWLDTGNNNHESLTQMCITKNEVLISNKKLKDEELNLVFDLKNYLLEDLVLKQDNSKNISQNYYQIFSKKFKCMPANFNTIYLLSNISEIFNPSIFYDEDFLIKKTEILTFQNIYRFLQWSNSQEIIENYIGFGNVNYSDTGYELLPLSKDEIINSSKYFKNNRVFLDEDANKNNLENYTNSFLHFATHNDQIQNEDSIVNALILSGEGNEKYLLPSDIVNKDLGGSFILLSACNTFSNTFLGPSTTSEIYNAFLISGAKGVLSTTWDIDSSSAKEFTTNFFNSYSNNSQIDKSFRNAQLRLISTEQFSHPYHWAGFNLFH